MLHTRTDEPPAGLGRAAGTLALGHAVSRITGFARTVVLAAAIGLGLVGDAYNTANALPTLVYELVLGGVLSSIVVPLIVHARTDDDPTGDAYTQRLLTIITVVLVAATALAVWAAPLLTHAYGIRDDPDQVAVATVLARILLLEIVFYGVGGMLGAVLTSRGVFAPPAWAPVLNNLVVIATGVTFIAWRGGGEVTPATIGMPGVWLLGIGTTLGIVVQAAVLLPALRRAGLRWRWRFDWRNASLGEAGRLATWVLADAVVSQAGYLVIIATANAAGRASGVGSVVYTNATLLFQVPYGILGVALLTALLPRMSRAAAAGNTAEVVRDLSLGSRLSAVALFPIAAALVVLGPAVATVIFTRGQVGADQARAVGTVLAASAFGLVPMAVMTLQRQVFYAMKDARTPTLINVVMVALRIPACLACPHILPPDYVVVGLAVANSASFVVGAVVGEVWLRRRYGPLETRRLVRTVARIGLVSTMAGLAAWGAVAPVAAWLGPGVRGSTAALAAGCAVGAVALGLGLRLIRLPEVTGLVTLVRRRITRTGKADQTTK